MATPIISRRILICDDESHRPSLPSLRQLLSQGAISGAFGGFVIAVTQAIWMHNLYDDLLVIALPFYMAWTAFHGLSVGLAIWACMRVANHRLGGMARIGVAALTFCGISLVLRFWLTPHASWLPEFLRTFGVFTAAIVMVVMVGSVTGSTRQPGHAFSHGLRNIKTGQPLLASIIGSVLRIVVLFGLLDSFLFLVCLAQLEYQSSTDLRVANVGFLYFLVASLILFANPKVCLTTILVLLLHSPLIFVLLKFPNDIGYVWHFIVGYLSLWGAFLLTQFRALYWALSVAKEELRYYLID